MPEKAKKGWARVAFGDVVQLCRERSSNPADDGFDRYVGLEHLEPGDLKIRRWGNVVDGTTFTSLFRAGQVLFGKRRAYQRKVAVAEFDGVCSGDIYVLEPKNDRLLSGLLPFICQTDGFFEHAVGTSAGSLSPRTNWESLASYEFALPPLEEQRRIAEALGAIDKVVGSTVETVERQKEIRLALLDDLWKAVKETTTLGELINEGPQNGLYKPASAYGDGVPILRIDSFVRGALTEQRSWNRLRLDDSELCTYVLRADDIVINRVNSREFVGQCAVVPVHSEPLVFESNIMRMSVKEGIVRPAFVVACINHPRSQRQVRQRRKDAVNQSSINQEDVRSLSLPRLTLEQQDKVMLFLKAFDKLSTLTDSRIRLLVGLKTRILDRCLDSSLGV